MGVPGPLPRHCTNKRDQKELASRDVGRSTRKQPYKCPERGNVVLCSSLYTMTSWAPREAFILAFQNEKFCCIASSKGTHTWYPNLLLLSVCPCANEARHTHPEPSCLQQTRPPLSPWSRWTPPPPPRPTRHQPPWSWRTRAASPLSNLLCLHVQHGLHLLGRSGNSLRLLGCGGTRSPPSRLRCPSRRRYLSILDEGRTAC